MAKAKEQVFSAITALLERRDAGAIPFDESTLIDDELELDSLELAELSAILEDEFGTDPYSAGELPRTVGEVIGFFDQIDSLAT